MTHELASATLSTKITKFELNISKMLLIDLKGGISLLCKLDYIYYRLSIYETCTVLKNQHLNLTQSSVLAFLQVLQYFTKALAVPIRLPL